MADEVKMVVTIKDTVETPTGQDKIPIGQWIAYHHLNTGKPMGVFFRISHDKALVIPSDMTPYIWTSVAEATMSEHYKPAAVQMVFDTEGQSE